MFPTSNILPVYNVITCFFDLMTIKAISGVKSKVDGLGSEWTVNEG